MKELTRTYSALLSNRAVKAEQNKYESFSRQRGSVMSKYKKVHQAFSDLQSGLERARGFYAEMKDTVDSLHKNVDSFVNNRRSEGHQLLTQIEASKSASGGAQAGREQARLKELMERMAINPAIPSPLPQGNMPQPPPRPAALTQTPSYQNAYNPAVSPPVTPGYGMPTPVTNTNGGLGGYPNPMSSPRHQQPLQQQQQSGYPQMGQQNGNASGSAYPYNPNAYAAVSSPQASHQPHASQQQQQPQQNRYFSPPPGQYQGGAYGQQQQQPQQQGAYTQMGYVPPPPPPGSPPQGQLGHGYGGYAPQPGRGQQQQQQQQGSSDPWAGLNAWK